MLQGEVPIREELGGLSPPGKSRRRRFLAVEPRRKWTEEEVPIEAEPAEGLQGAELGE